MQRSLVAEIARQATVAEPSAGVAHSTMANRSASSSVAASSEPASKKSRRAPLNDEERQDLRAELVASGRGMKQTVANTLMNLHARGLLSDASLGATKYERRLLAKASAQHANAETPYGKVVQHIVFATNGGADFTWPIIHPFAYIWHLSKTVPDFGAVMAASIAAADGRTLELILYGDELTPGNPLRADGGRCAFNFYYSFANFPRWLLHRKDGWLCLGSLRTSMIGNIKGGVGALVARLLKLLFVDGCANFRKGFMFIHDGQPEMCTASFKGFLADEKGLKEFYDIKGQGGTKPCISCKNVVNFIHKRDRGGRPRGAYTVGLDVVDRALLHPHSNASIFAMADRLEAAHQDDSVTSAAFDEMEKLYGVNYRPASILFDGELRDVVRPVDNYIRDWQHTLVSSGVASTEIAVCLTVLQKDRTCKAHGITLAAVEEYSKHFVLPSCRGKINENWFRSKFLTTDHVKHFSSDVLAMIPILESFLVQVIRPLGVMLDNVKSMTLLSEIMSFLQLTMDISPSDYEYLRKLVDEHHVIFQKIYAQNIKVKFHHLLHLPEDLRRVGSVVSCFVTERKHRDWKRTSLYAFRNVEQQSTIDFVNYSIQEMVTGRFQFVEQYLAEPETLVVDGLKIEVATTAYLRAGEVRHRDVVIAGTADSTVVGEILRFFSCDGVVVAEILAYEPIVDNAGDFSTVRCSTMYVDGASVRSKLMWSHRRKGVLHALLPPAALR